MDAEEYMAVGDAAAQKALEVTADAELIRQLLYQTADVIARVVSELDRYKRENEELRTALRAALGGNPKDE